ncbi:MAG: universal stress protein [Thermodesulfobacteriota bacterium]
MGQLASSGRFARLLVCIDGSPDSEGALAGALVWAKLWGSKIYLLEVLEFIPGYTGLAPEFVLQWENEVRAYLEALKAEAAPSGVPLETRMRTGESAPGAIIAAAKEIAPDLIVMGRHGRGGLARLMMGSVTARIIGHSPCPVLVVPQDPPLTWQKILLASDGSPYSKAAWEEALALSRQWGSALLAVSVAREEGELPLAEEIAHQLMKSANQQGLPLETQVTIGQPDDAIIQLALKNQADLIILGSHGRTGWKRLLMGSVTERVIGQAPCPVLVVPQAIS